MKTFKIGRNVEAVCRSENTRYGFRHLASLMVDGYEVAKAKACYYNRTWESYEFESVLFSLLAQSSGVLSDYHQKKFKKLIKNGWQKAARKEIDREFNSIAMLASLGDILGQNQKETNDWKTRIIKAGLGDKGLIVPDDWNELDEETKEIRLNNVINHLKSED